jgi:AcrR family transcriptional regulator
MSGAKVKGPPRPRPRGRPRSVSVDSALVEAARDEFLAKGFHAMSMEAIAARAGVSKVSLYRRWKSKHAATADVLRLLSETRVPEDHGSLEADILALIEASIGSPEATASAKVLMRTMGEISDHPELLALYRTHLFAPRVAQIRALVERARVRKEISDVPTDIAAAAIAGPLFLYSLTLLADPDRKWPNDLAKELTRSILLGIAAKRPARSSSTR